MFLTTLFSCWFSAYGSSNVSASVRVDRRFHSMPVLRFKAGTHVAICLSPVTFITYLRLNIFNPRRHRPARQSNDAPTVLSECDNEDPQCHRCGHLSQAWRLRRRHYLCVLLHELELLIAGLLRSLVSEHLSMSHYIDSTVAKELEIFSLELRFPKLCNMLSKF